MLFFTVVPLYEEDEEGKKIGSYDPDAQIHAGWLLTYAGGLLSQEEQSAVLDAYENLGYQLRNFGKGEQVRYVKAKVKDGASEPKRRKKKAADSRGGTQVPGPSVDAGLES